MARPDPRLIRLALFDHGAAAVRIPFLLVDGILQAPALVSSTGTFAYPLAVRDGGVGAGTGV